MKIKSKLIQFLDTLFSCADYPATHQEVIEQSMMQRIKALKNKAKSNINPNEQSR
jgi:hypothetical protein